MRRQFPKTTGLAMLWLAAAVLWWTPAALAKAQPLMVLPETSHDFGQVFEGTPLSHTFVIQNKGGAPLKIEDVDPDCACTVPRYDKAIPPRGQGEITLTIKPYSLMYNFRKKTVVRTNDPERPEAVLMVTGSIQPLIEIQPGHVIRFRGDPREVKPARIRFVSHLSTPLEIKEWRTSIPDKIEVQIQTEEPGRVYVLEVKNRSREAERYAGFVELFTNSKERPRLLVRVIATFYPPAAVP